MVESRLHLEEVITKFDYVITFDILLFFEFGFSQVVKCGRPVEEVSKSKLFYWQMHSTEYQAFRVLVKSRVLWIYISRQTFNLLNRVSGYIVYKDCGSFLANKQLAKIFLELKLLVEPVLLFLFLLFTPFLLIPWILKYTYWQIFANKGDSRVIP